MSTLQQAAQQALEKLKKMEDLLEESITSLKAALEQPEPEAHSYCYVRRGTSVDILTFDDMPQDAIAGTIYPLYAAPPAAQRPWQRLTDEDLDYLCHLAYTGDEEFALAVQARLKERNT
jgi:hypothetical protein